MKTFLKIAALTIAATGLTTAQPTYETNTAAVRALVARNATPNKTISLQPAASVPTDRDVLLVARWSGSLQVVWGQRYPTQADSMTLFADLPGNSFIRVAAAGDGTVFAFSANSGLFRLRDTGRSGFASTFDQYPSVADAYGVAPLNAESVLIGRSGNPYLLQHFLTEDQIVVQSMKNLRGAGSGIISIAVIGQDVYTLDANGGAIYKYSGGVRMAEPWMFFPPGMQASAISSDGKSIYALVPPPPPQCSPNGTCATTAAAGQILKLVDSPLPTTGPSATIASSIGGGPLSSTFFGQTSFVMSKGVAYVGVYSPQNDSDPGGMDIWAVDISTGMMYMFLSHRIIPDISDFSLYPVRLP